jgi:DNA glycosylase AlkZ-like
LATLDQIASYPGWVTDLRAWWWHRQGLDGSLAGAAPAQVLERTGWARSVGGSNPYLTLFARAGTSRAEVDKAVAEMEIYELPSARGCTYVLPKVHFGLGLLVGEGVPEADLRTLEKLGVTRKEIDELCEAVVEALPATGSLDPARLKDKLGDAVRNLGEEGKKRGQSTTLPPALGLLQAEGRIRRVPVNGRLDQQRYSYARWSRPPFDGDPAKELARLYFDWIGPAALGHFRWFSAFSAATAKKALPPLTEVEGHYLSPTLVKEFEAYEVPQKPVYNLLAGIDALILLRRDHHALIDVDATVPGDARSLLNQPDLPDHPIIDRGRVIGLWEYDAEARRIVSWVFGGKRDKALGAVIERTEAFIRDELGDARSFSLDSPRSRAPRLAALRSAAG